MVAEEPGTLKRPPRTARIVPAPQESLWMVREAALPPGALQGLLSSCQGHELPSEEPVARSSSIAHAYSAQTHPGNGFCDSLVSSSSPFSLHRQGTPVLNMMCSCERHRAHVVNSCSVADQGFPSWQATGKVTSASGVAWLRSQSLLLRPWVTVWVAL